jgi:hypothetical protein
MRCVGFRPFCAASGGWPSVARTRQLWQTPLRQDEGMETPWRSIPVKRFSPDSSVYAVPAS